VNITPTQIRELQSAINAYAGDTAWHHKILVTPPGAHVFPMRPTDLADQFDEFLANEIAMVFDVDPMALGIIPNVSTTVSPFAAKEMAASSKTVHERTSTKPLLKFLISIAHAVLHRVCSQDDMKFTFAGLDEAQDQAAQTDLLVKQVQNGMISIDEAREELQRTAWGLDETSGPLVFTQMGPVPLNQIIQMLHQQQPMQTGQNAAANSAGAVAGTAGGSTQSRAVHHPPSSRPVGTHNPRLGLPSGAPAGPELPPEGPGRRVSDTPAHTAARAHSAASQTGRKAAGNGVAERPPARAVTAELEALARHLRRCRNISEWKPNHLSGQVMAVIAEDLTKGIGVDEVIRSALTIALPGSEYEWADKAAPSPQSQSQQQSQTTAQQQAQALAQRYAQRIRAVFAAVAKAAASLIRQWLQGVLAVTAAGLAAMIAALLAKRLGPVLKSLWRDAWAAGRDSAAAVLGVSPSGSENEAARDAWIASHGRDWLERLVTTHEDNVTAGLDAAARNGEDAQTIASKLEDWLDAAGRSVLIAVDQVQRALNAAVMAVARKLGVVQKKNVTAGDDRVCAKCRANAAAGWLNFTEPYPSGQLEGPFHPRCRCHQDLRLDLNASAQKSAGRRYVDLPGQEWWPADSYPHGPAMGGGGPMHAAHDADDIQQYIPGGVPGMTAGGEPPRWDGDEPDPVISSSPQTVSAGRGNVQTRGGGTVGGPYEDFSDETHVHVPDGHDDAQWPGERAVGPVAGRSWPLQGYMGGYWPEGGHGTTQAPGGPVAGGTERGRAPNAFGKAESPAELLVMLLKGTPSLADAEPVDAEIVHRQLLGNYPPDSIAWVLDPSVRWVGPCEVPLDEVDVRDETTWAAHHQQDAVDRFAREMEAGTGHTEPVIMVREPGQRTRVIDGHHRFLACRKLGWPCKSYVGYVQHITTAMEETHSSQRHQGDSPLNKGAGHDPIAAGLAVRAADTGRILMLQRAFDESGDDPAAGYWECPGGRLDDGEDALTAARREWSEETGCQVPDGDLDGIWNSSNGKYRGFVLTVPDETCVPIFGDRDDVSNPDDPDRDAIEALAWWDPGQFKDNPALRPELQDDVKRVRRALKMAWVIKSAETPMLEATPHLLGPHGLWHTPDRHVGIRQKLPNYVEHIAAALMRDQGLDESTAIAYAINAIKRWARGDLHWGHGKVTPAVVAASQRALAEWEQLRSSHH
jgi:8-oxo-dGTP pyrophosphatase MutT (NUDIX family)